MGGCIQFLEYNSNSFLPFSTAAQARTLAPAWEIRKDAMIIYGSEYVYDTLSASSITQLQNYINLSPFYYSEGVFYSRVMLNFNSSLGINPFKKGIELQIEKTTIEVYPNPSIGNISIKFRNPLQGMAHVTIWTPLGNILRSEYFAINGDLLEMDISDFSAGMYFLSVEIKELRHTIRIIKQ
jgi:hypothetical protein